MAVTGKTGADAIFKALKRCCIVLSHYQTKLLNVIAQAESENVITAAQATTARDFINGASAFCVVFNLVADYSGF